MKLKEWFIQNLDKVALDFCNMQDSCYECEIYGEFDCPLKYKQLTVQQALNCDMCDLIERKEVLSILKSYRNKGEYKTDNDAWQAMYQEVRQLERKNSIVNEAQRIILDDREAQRQFFIEMDEEIARSEEEE